VSVFDSTGGRARRVVAVVQAVGDLVAEGVERVTHSVALALVLLVLATESVVARRCHGPFTGDRHTSGPLRGCSKTVVYRMGKKRFEEILFRFWKELFRNGEGFR